LAIVLESSAKATANASSVTVSKPTGTAEGDLLVAFLGIRASKSSANITLPSGFTEASIEGGQNPTLQVSYKVAGASEGADYTFTLNSSANHGVILARFSGVNTSSPSDATATTGTAGYPPGSTSPTLSAITTSTDGAFVLAAYVLNLSGSTYTITAPSGMTEIDASEDGTVNLEASYVSQATAGSSGDKTATVESAAGWAGILWAIEPAASGAVQLTVADATHGHTVDNVALTQHNTLAVADAAQGHTVDGNLVLTQHNVLAIQDASQGHTADNLDLTAYPPGVTLTVQDATHGHTADNVDLTQHNVLAVQDAAHAHTADGSLALVQHNILTVADATHGHTAENLTLTAHDGIVLVVQDASHGHTAENLALTQHNVMVVQDAFHLHFADGPLNWPGSGALGNDMASLWMAYRRKRRRKVRYY